jgi:hypothetical protein
MSRLLAALALVSGLVPGAQAATARRTLDAYALLASEELRVRALHVRRGDIGVTSGRFISAGTLDAAGAQVVADRVRLVGGATCAAVLTRTAKGGGPKCPIRRGDPGAVIADLAEACGIPPTLPACNPAHSVSVGRRATRTLPAGAYGDVVVAGATLELTGGRYVFCSLRAVRRAQVHVHGPSEIIVAGKMGLDGTLVPAPGVALSPNDVRIFVGGPRVVVRAPDLVARVCAPRALVQLGSATVHGSVVGRRIEAAGVTMIAPYSEDREPCTQRNRMRNVYFGDLHVHTTLSFDAHSFDVRTTQPQAYRFARGEAVMLPPLDEHGQGTQPLRLDRPLDFAAITDHSEFLGEVELCITPGSPTYDSPSCQTYRAGGNVASTIFGFQTALSPPARLPDICGTDGRQCLTEAAGVWGRIQQAAADAYDRTAACGFTSFVAYEYTGTKAVSTLHRNVIFRNDHVPFPTSVFEQPTAQGLWTELRTTCATGDADCDVLAIPHNSNESNGKMFLIEYPGASGVDDQRTQAELRGAMEPLVEIYQHKGDSECSNGLAGIMGAPDEQCEFEKRRRPPFDDCGDGTGAFGTITLGCVSRRDFVRGALLEGLKEDQRLGTNPLRLGIVASTDTHNGTPGAVTEDSFLGHRGTDDGTPAARLGEGQFYLGGYRFSPGGLAAVWAEENSRPALFDALRRREVYGTSGPRITVRFFGGWSLGSGLCGDPNLVETAYLQGVPMGGFLAVAPSGAGAPSFLVSALRDPGTGARPGTPLQRIQIVKGWLADGEPHQQVYDGAGDANDGATVNDTTCLQSGPGFDSLCTVWTDPDFDPSARAFYYVRVLENPSCRWSTFACNALPPDQRPPSCTDPSVPRTIQERAWTSPIWYRPPSG